jgi:hypothetical protein
MVKVWGVHWFDIRTFAGKSKLGSEQVRYVCVPLLEVEVRLKFDISLFRSLILTKMGAVEKKIHRSALDLLRLYLTASN